MTPTEFKARFGFEPRQDDIARAECPNAGKIGHFGCGVCPEHDLPRFYCGCMSPAPDEEKDAHG